jgi:hypothetical protein
MKSFINFLIENPVLEEPRDIERKPVKRELPENAYSLGTFTHDRTDYHFFGHMQGKDSPYVSERQHTGYITTKDDNGKHTVVGVSDFYPDQNEHNTFVSNYPKLNKEHKTRGLMSLLYKKMADHNKFTLKSDRIHTYGGYNVWWELSQMGRVTAHNLDKPSARGVEYVGSNPKHLTKFYKGSPTMNPARWIFKYKGI